MGWLLYVTAGVAAVGVGACVLVARSSFEERGRQLEERGQQFEEQGGQLKEQGRQLKEQGRQFEEQGRQLKHSQQAGTKLGVALGDLRRQHVSSLVQHEHTSNELESAKQHLRCALDECTPEVVSAFSPSQARAYLEACLKMGVSTNLPEEIATYQKSSPLNARTPILIV